MLTAGEALAKFKEHYGTNHVAGARIFSAPGRVNLIGEHTDYNDGFVLPMAIDQRTFVVAAPREDRVIRAVSADEPDPIEFEIGGGPGGGDDPSRGWANGWGRYVYGVAECLRQEGFDQRGADLYIASDVPAGAGLSSSAALEISTGFGLLAMLRRPIDLIELALIAQRAEHQFAGTRSGIMDQYVSCLGVEGCALLIDCRRLEHRLAPIGSDNSRVVVCNSMVKHDLASGEYNRRRAECEEGVRMLAKYLPDIRALRDVNIHDFDLYADALPEIVRRRCRHVVTENARTLAAAEALESDDLNLFGRLMYESHQSLRDDYEVSCFELDLLVKLASRCAGVYGARLTGGGFGGCTVNLVAPDSVEAFVEIISREYEKEVGARPDCYICLPSAGVSETPL